MYSFFYNILLNFFHNSIILFLHKMNKLFTNLFLIKIYIYIYIFYMIQLYIKKKIYIRNRKIYIYIYIYIYILIYINKLFTNLFWSKTNFSLYIYISSYSLYISFSLYIIVSYNLYNIYFIIQNVYETKTTLLIHTLPYCEIRNFRFNWWLHESSYLVTFSSKRKKNRLQTEMQRERENSRREVCGSSPRCTNFFHPTVYHPPLHAPRHDLVLSPRPLTRSTFVTVGEEGEKGEKDPNHGQHSSSPLLSTDPPLFPFLPIFRPFLLLLHPRLEGGQPRAGRRAR